MVGYVSDVPFSSIPFVPFLIPFHLQAGKVVGPKGATMQDMKVRSGAVQVRVDKNPRDFCGIMMRVVTIEGTPLAVKKAHFCFQELFLPDAAHQLVLAESGGGGGASMPPPTASYGGHQDGTDAAEPKADADGGGGGGYAHDDGAYLRPLYASMNGGAGAGEYGLAEIPLDELKAFGVLPAVVDTLHDLKQLFKDQVRMWVRRRLWLSCLYWHTLNSPTFLFST